MVVVFVVVVVVVEVVVVVVVVVIRTSYTYHKFSVKILFSLLSDGRCVQQMRQCL
jgi:hypothetical protein